MTTSTSYIATVSTTVVYMTLTSTVTSPGYAPSSACQIMTVTNVIPSTTTINVTYDLSYVTSHPISPIPFLSQSQPLANHLTPTRQIRNNMGKHNRPRDNHHQGIQHHADLHKHEARSDRLRDHRDPVADVHLLRHHSRDDDEDDLGEGVQRVGLRDWEVGGGIRERGQRSKMSR